MKWTSEATEILKSRYQTDGPVKLAKELGVTRASVTLKARRLGLTKKINWTGFIWTDEMIAILKDRYVSEGGPAVAEAIGAHISTVRRKAVEFGLHTNAGRISEGRNRAEARSSCDIHYFDQWSPNMAYILGFIFADGSITKRLCDVVIGIAKKDEALLQWIKEELKSTRPIYVSKSDRIKDGYQRQDAHYLYLGSSILVQRLIALGLKPRKTYNDDPFPEIPNEMLPHFIRGYFDGDGTVFIREEKRWRGTKQCIIGFVGSPRFITGLRDSLVRLAGMSNLSVRAEINKVAVGRVNWSRNTDLRIFFDFIYPPGHGFCLQRKKTILENWLSSLVGPEASSTTDSLKGE